MNPKCEKIIIENEKLKLSDMEKSCNNIFEFLNLHYHINYLKIIIIENDKIEILYNNTEEDLIFINDLQFKQNDKTVIKFEFYTDNTTEYQLIIDEFETIRLSLLIFSQSLYNKYIEKSLTEMTLIDPLTGTYNRRYLNNYIKNIFSLSNREQKKIAFLKVGIDQFKAVIDEFDYDIGDEVLKKLCFTLKHGIRESDLVIKIANDEFLVILMNIINEENAIMISEKLINNFSEEEVVVNSDTNQTLKKTICVGITIYPDDALTIDEIMKKSDIALYEARNRGRSHYYRYKEEQIHTIDLF